MLTCGCAAGSSRRRCSSPKPSTRRVGARVLFKAECLQHSGSFKIRGALNRLLQLSADERHAGVVAFSSGNHAQAVALAARWLDDARDDRHAGRCAEGEARAHARIRRRGRALRPRARGSRGDRRADRRAARRRARAAVRSPAHHRGAGHARARARPRRARLGIVDVDALYVPCSGGGLVAGCALAIKAEWPDCAVYAVEPRGFEDHGRVAGRGRAARIVAPAARRCATACARRLPGAITFAINRRELAGALAVDDEQIRGAMAVAAQHLKVVVEPSGAAALAAVLAEPRPRGSVRRRRAVGRQRRRRSVRRRAAHARCPTTRPCR